MDMDILHRGQCFIDRVGGLISDKQNCPVGWFCFYNESAPLGSEGFQAGRCCWGS